LDSEIFEDCYKSYLNNFDDGRSWKVLAEEYGYPSGESIRASFKRQRKANGMPSKNKIQEIRKPEIKSKCKILFYDVENSPVSCLTFRTYQTNISPKAILEDWHLICWSANWILEDEIMSDVLTVEEAKNHDDERIVRSLWKLLDEADVCVGHNIEGFDNKKMNTRFLFHGLPPVSHYQSIDTLRIARENFAMTSNTLDYINQYLGISQKTDTDFDLWKRVWFADPEALKEMVLYNQNDVRILPDLFFKLRPYMKGLVNMNLWNEENVSICPNCGSEHLTWKGDYYTFTQRYNSFRCDDCGAVGRSKVNNLSKEKRKSIVR
jgi:hypothetical protein